MKTRMFLTPFLVAVSMLCAATLTAVAQQPSPGGGLITQEQRSKMRETLQTSQADLSQLTNKLAAAQKEAIKAALAKDADEKAVRTKIEAVTKIQADIAMLRFKAVKEIASTLTDEQKTQMDARPGSAFNTLFGSTGGGGIRRGAGGGGGGGNR